VSQRGDLAQTRKLQQPENERQRILEEKAKQSIPKNTKPVLTS